MELIVKVLIIFYDAIFEV